MKFKNGKYLMPGDPKMDPIYEMCAKYHRPIMIHTGDPAAFFTPLDQYNERWHELNSHPDWLFYGKDPPARIPSLKELLDCVPATPWRESEDDIHWRAFAATIPRTWRIGQVA